MSKIELHIFTNPSKYKWIDSTYNSFIGTFGTMKTAVWCHSKPNHPYVKSLNKFNNINFTNSLADGYIKAIMTSKSKYLFMLEHDWEFLKIDHSLDEIIYLMDNDGLHYIRFNKRKNTPAKWDRWLKEVNSSISYCITPNVSNNPHIINRKMYLKYVKNGWIVDRGGSKGVEEVISNHIDGVLYGPENHPPTIKHLDGRGTWNE